MREYFKTRPRLTIAIPTFNRQKEIAEIALWITDVCERFEEVEIIVSDNASPFDIRSVFVNLPTVRLVVGNINIGAGPNILKLFELATGDWIWLLGDDNKPVAGAVQQIFNYISNVDDDICELKFSSHLHSVNSVLAINDCNKLMNAFSLEHGMFSNFLFLSTSIYRASTVKAFLRYAYEMGALFGPHIFPPLMSMKEQRSKILFLPEFIVEWKPANPDKAWSSYRLTPAIVIGLETSHIFTNLHDFRSLIKYQLLPFRFIIKLAIIANAIGDSLYFSILKRLTRDYHGLFAAFTFHAIPLFGKLLHKDPRITHEIILWKDSKKW